MNQEQFMYLSLYNSIVSKIRMGTYQMGENLGTSEQMCRQYHVGITTIRRVRKLLQENNYISSSRGKRPPVIIYDITDPSNLEQDPLISLFQKKDALQSLYHSLPGLMPIFIVQGAAAFDINDLPLLESFIQRLDHSPETGEHIIHIIAGFMDTILIKFKNPIVMDFRRELILFQTVPFYTAKQSGFLDPCISMWRDLLIRIMEAIKNQQLLSVYNYTKNFFDTVKNAVDNFLDGLPEASELKQQPFFWEAGKKDMHLYWKVLFQIVEKIDKGIYPEQEFLPSIADLAAIYQVSEVTVRNVLQILKQCKIVSIVNGAGTKVAVKTSWKEAPSFEQPYIKESIWNYLYTLQFLILVCVEPAIHASELFKKEEIDEIERYITFTEPTDCARLGTVQFLDLVIKHTANSIMKTILSELKKMLYWRYCLYFCKEKEHYPKIVQQQASMLSSLKKKDYIAFGYHLCKAFYISYENVRKILISQGIANEEDIVLIQLEAIKNK